MPRRTRRTTPRPEARKREERLQKILAAAGIASRRAAEALIREGRVRLNGRVVMELGTRADPQRDRIHVDGRRVATNTRRQSYLVYKPRGVVTTTRDPHATKTVLDLVSSRARLFPVGRLDAPSEGLLLLTNDGELTHALLHPSFEVPRTYRVSVKGEFSAAEARQVAGGVELDGRRTAPCEVRVLSASTDRSVVEITLIEGRRRQIREVMRLLDHPVRRLLRTRFGPLRLGTLKPGESRRLRPAESQALERMLAQARARKPRRS